MRKPGPNDMERGEFIRALEVYIEQTVNLLNDAVYTHNDEMFQRGCLALNMASTDWLQAAQGMTPEQARSTMIGFAATTIKPWMDRGEPGPPPTILSVYDGPISDEEFGKKMRQRQKPR